MGIKLVRLDFRLIHGQVMAKWVKTVGTDTILVVNDDLVKDKFMLGVYKMSAPKGIQVKIATVQGFIKHWKETKFDELNALVLIKTVDDLYKLYQAGVVFDAVQIGGLGGSPGRKAVWGPVTLDKRDADRLAEINDSGQRIYFHQVPENGSAEFKDVMRDVTF